MLRRLLIIAVALAFIAPAVAASTPVYAQASGDAKSDMKDTKKDKKAKKVKKAKATKKKAMDDKKG